MITVNAIGDACPIPVVKTRKAMETIKGSEVVETLVDNEIAVENLKKMAGQMGYQVKDQKLEEGKYSVQIMVTEAEKELKRKTGQVKRAMVWDWLVERFPIITLFITEEKYDELLDEALEKFKKMLESNSSLYDYVYNTVTVSDEDTEDDILRKITEGA